jgi:hypothetical protein
MILRIDILNPLLGVQWTDNVHESLSKSFINAVIPAIVGSGKSGLIN